MRKYLFRVSTSRHLLINGLCYLLGTFALSTLFLHLLAFFRIMTGSSFNRKPFHAGQSNAVAGLRLNPDNPPSSSRDAVRKQQAAMASNSDFKMAPSGRNGLGGQPNSNKKRSVDKLNQSDGAMKKRIRLNTSRRAPRTSDVSEGRPDDQGYGSDIKETEFENSEDPDETSTGKHGPPIHSRLICRPWQFD